MKYIYRTVDNDHHFEVLPIQGLTSVLVIITYIREILVDYGIKIQYCSVKILMGLVNVFQD